MTSRRSFEISATPVYQLSSDANEYNRDDSNGYSRYYPKRLTAEVLLDSIDLSLGLKHLSMACQLGRRRFRSQTLHLVLTS